MKSSQMHVVIDGDGKLARNMSITGVIDSTTELYTCHLD
jgi:hypothetical protein